jgi:spore maturation protein CgeB
VWLPIDYKLPLINGFRSQKNAPQIKARNFEIPFFYGFQLTDYVSSIEDYFNIADVVEWSRVLDIRLSEWSCSVSML